MGLTSLATISTLGRAKDIHPAGSGSGSAWSAVALQSITTGRGHLANKSLRTVALAMGPCGDSMKGSEMLLKALERWSGDSHVGPGSSWEDDTGRGSLIPCLVPGGDTG